LDIGPRLTRDWVPKYFATRELGVLSLCLEGGPGTRNKLDVSLSDVGHLPSGQRFVVG
jgi:hypothetical protein